MDEQFKKVLYKQFSIIGKESEVDTIDFKDDINPWYALYTWTEAQENEFKQWLIEELTKDSKLRKVIMKIPSRTKKKIEHVVNQFLWMYGFRVSYNES